MRRLARRWGMNHSRRALRLIACYVNCQRSAFEISGERRWRWGVDDVLKHMSAIATMNQLFRFVAEGFHVTMGVGRSVSPSLWLFAEVWKWITTGPRSVQLCARIGREESHVSCHSPTASPFDARVSSVEVA